MSWLFGYKTPQPQMTSAGLSEEGGQPPNTAGQASGDQKLTSAERKAMEAYRFDSSALERAAEAAKTLERSSNFVGHCCITKCFMTVLQSMHERHWNCRKCKRPPGNKSTKSK